MLLISLRAGSAASRTVEVWEENWGFLSLARGRPLPVSAFGGVPGGVLTNKGGIYPEPCDQAGR